MSCYFWSSFFVNADISYLKHTRCFCHLNLQPFRHVHDANSCILCGKGRGRKANVVDKCTCESMTVCPQCTQDTRYGGNSAGFKLFQFLEYRQRLMAFYDSDYTKSNRTFQFIQNSLSNENLKRKYEKAIKIQILISYYIINKFNSCSNSVFCLASHHIS